MHKRLEDGLTAELMDKDLTLIPRKKLLRMAEVCKHRRFHYKDEMVLCLKENDNGRRKKCLDVFKKVKKQVEYRCGRLKTLFTKIFKFINDLRVWARRKGPSTKYTGGSKKSGKPGKGLKRMIKKQLKKTKRKIKQLKKLVKKDIKKAGNAKKFLKKVKRKL